MKVSLIHQDIEWSEKQLKKEFEKRGIPLIFYDVRTVNVSDLEDSAIVLNRVYASVANRNYKDNLKVLEILNQLEDKGVFCLNSAETSYVDYSKFFSYQIMKQNGLSTPETIFLNSDKDISNAESFADKYSFPLIVKRDMGGRGEDLHKVENKEELVKTLKSVLSPEHKQLYDAGWVVQEYLKNNVGYDCRIAYIGNEFAFSFKRSLVSLTETDSEPWLASTCKGSVRSEFDAPQDVRDIGKKATEAIGAMFNEMDITFTKNGPYIIESNPTPQYFEGVDEHRVAKAVDLIITYYMGNKQ